MTVVTPPWQPRRRGRRSRTLGESVRSVPRGFVGALMKRKVKRPGTAPGTVARLDSADAQANTVRITVTEYTADAFREFEDVTPAEAVGLAMAVRDRGDGVAWINVEGVHDPAVVATLCDAFGVHILAQEDILNVYQRPKVEDYEGSLFFVLKMIRHEAGLHQLRVEQVSLVLVDRVALCFQEEHGDVFEGVRERIRTGARIRTRGADYLVYALVDAVVDHYFLALEGLSAAADRIESELLDHPCPDHMRFLQLLKGTLLVFRRAALPLREVFTLLPNLDTDLIRDQTRTYLRDVQDHMVQVAEGLDSLREVVTVLTDLYFSSMVQKQNNVIYVLTLLAAVFLPLTFIVGVYGMNFEFMPELRWRHGYAAVWGVMVSVAAGLLFWFRTKRWL